MEGTIFDQMKRVRLQLPRLAPKLFHINTKDRGIIPFTPSVAQKTFWEDDKIGSDIVLKARQLGISTMTVIEFLAYAMFIDGFNGAVISEDRDKTKKLLQKVHLALNMLPEENQIPREHSREDYIIFKAPPEGTGSSLYIGTAGTKSYGRGDTIHAAHCSELGLWPDAEELLNGLEESVPLRDGAILRIESTAYGRGNHFHKLCDRAMHKRGGRYRFHFFPWWYALDDEYRMELEPEENITPTDAENDFIEQTNEHYSFHITDEHLKWRRTKIDQKGEDNFMQEYPEDPESCFLSTGNAVFHGITNLLFEAAKRLRYLEPTYERTIRGVKCKIWRAAKAGRTYLLTVDTSEGSKDTSDYDAISVWEADNGELKQCVTGAGRVDSSSLTHAICELSEEYNNALVAVERASTGFSILDKLLEAQEHYDFEIYNHSEFDQSSGKRRSIPGWRPTLSAKIAACGRFEEMFKLGECQVKDVEVLDQAMAYQHNPRTGALEAPEGSYDDLLTTTYIACYIAEEIDTYSDFDVVSIV